MAEQDQSANDSAINHISDDHKARLLHPPQLVRSAFTDFINHSSHYNDYNQQLDYNIGSGFTDKLSIDSSTSLSLHDFFHFLLNPELNSLLWPFSRKIKHDMSAPLSHYYIYASHNSYLTGNQLTSKSGTSVIQSALVSGCRVIELDCWPGEHGILVYHGRTLTKSVAFEECLHAIKENAFVSSEYPVIITIENHLDDDLQRLAAKLIREILADALFVPSSDDRADSGRGFASPEKLKWKIIISDAPQKEPIHSQTIENARNILDQLFLPLSSHKPAEECEAPSPSLTTNAAYKANSGVKSTSGDEMDPDLVHRTKSTCVDELKELIYIFSVKLEDIQESPSGKLVTAQHRFIMANFSEPQLQKLAKEHPTSLMKFSIMNLGRMYPYGLRVDSSNPDPFLAWGHGFQLAAINIQAQDTACWVAKALFDLNGGCGYIKKPFELLHMDGKTFQDIQNMPPKLLLQMKILTGTGPWQKTHSMFKHPSFYVKIALEGIPSDIVRHSTDTVDDIDQPNWEHQLFQFPIRVPEIAVLRLELWQRDRFLPLSDAFLGQACFGVSKMRAGIRAIQLLSKSNITSETKLLCWIQMDKLQASHHRALLSRM